MTAAVVVLAVLAIGLAGAGWRADAGSRQQRLLALAMVGALTAVAVLVLVAGPSGTWGPAASRTLLVLFGGLAVAGGGPVAVAVLSVADRPPATERVAAAGDGEQESSGQTDELAQHEESEPREEGEVLRGGAWIGSLERLGIFASFAAGWPGGVALVLAVKGVGRYQELGETGAAERFIIGTFASVLWASACAGVWWYG